MSDASILSTFLVVFREALEASLIVGIILALLHRLRETRYFPHVLASSGVAVLVSLLAGAVLMQFTKHFRHEAQELIEGLISIAACGVLTYMVFWMERQAKRIRPEIESQIEEALSTRDLAVIVALPFLAVFREGAETVLFLIAMAQQNSGAVSLLGGVLGLILACAIVLAIFVGGKKVPLKPLFRISGFFLLLVAAGLLVTGIHEFQELGILPEIKKNVWNINPILSEKHGFGAFLKSLFGYNGNPSLLEVIAYGLYLTGIFMFLRRREAIPAQVAK